MAAPPLLREWKPGVVHARNPGMAVVTALATRQGAVTPCVVTLHGVRRADDIATARLLRWARLPVIACDPGVAAGLRAHGTELMSTVVNGVGPPPSPAAMTALRGEGPAMVSAYRSLWLSVASRRPR